ncbi:hypothetical protein [Spirosoma sordidisoli]|uniref:O-antigen ligase domain-containing protein n=1 Tax=Spirosoma sordidisoli TaxID=2502893 RepID=A0A4Q2UHJ2_9BACT|nr:hypothetical protein [Spirosoma sordidisoli]RYC68546.1 hypothetical protein EQG79_19555 [Spirosoma sordidisoli]
MKLPLAISIENITSINKIIFSILLIEMFLGGSGRFTEITSFFTLRMALWLTGLSIVSAHIIICRKVRKNIVIVIAAYLLSMLFSSLLGIVNGVNSTFLFLDIKQFCFFIIILYFSLSINSERDIETVVRLLKRSSLILALLHVTIVFFVVLDIFNFGQVWYFFNIYATGQSDIDNPVSNEVFFKGSYGFIYYKGDFYLCVGLFFWIDSGIKNWKNRISVLVISFAIFLTGTRGFVLMVVLTYLVSWFVNIKNIKMLLRNKSILALITFVITCFLLALYIFNLEYSQYIGDKEESDAIRFIQISQVVDEIDFISIIFGHGFGYGIPIRNSHMEIAYLEILHKQGIIGLSLWLLLLVYIHRLYLLTKGEKFSRPFWLAVLFTYLLSATNPYVNHPLGFTLLSLCLVVYSVYYKNRQFEGKI